MSAVHPMSMKETVVRHTADACAAGISVACVVEWLPPAAAFLSIIWLSIQIIDWVYKKVFK